MKLPGVWISAKEDFYETESQYYKKMHPFSKQLFEKLWSLENKPTNQIPQTTEMEDGILLE